MGPAGVGEDGATNASCHCLMQISVMMSEAGVGHIEEILEMIFSYVSMLKDTYKAGGNKFPEYIFEELKSTHAMAYNFASEEQPEEFVENIVTCLSPCRFSLVSTSSSSSLALARNCPRESSRSGDS